MKHHRGSIEVICGSMFSGKSEELIRRVRRARIAKQTVQIFKPSVDDRYGIDSVNSHDGREIKAIAIEKAAEMLDYINGDTTVVAVDEAQFFDPGIVNICRKLADERNLRVIVAGLDLDFRAEPFGSMPDLMAIAEEVNKLHAICVVCGDEASRTQRLIDDKPAAYDDPIVLIGAADSYEARCRYCHKVPGRPE